MNDSSVLVCTLRQIGLDLLVRFGQDNVPFACRRVETEKGGVCAEELTASIEVHFVFVNYRGVIRQWA